MELAARLNPYYCRNSLSLGYFDFTLGRETLKDCIKNWMGYIGNLKLLNEENG